MAHRNCLGQVKTCSKTENHKKRKVNYPFKNTEPTIR
uniref:Uncharacterized protein n=1 Tax=Anguilla anguilla TaxID=7936 RepID=A0A0E9VWS4_ANGAN